ncbi:MAG: pyridoxine 5'-phosphate synthase [Candidatus Edwardsbacteria bacterium RifOxyA12_full_54_48]|jgi:pyridoxine 5-phosphate synthase|uniref:Pyridoxine 5'-phosphate synthase n=1 Tax=Candidatus Edwardsbacteria bacterium GWF2_54_11 TaxID=1817851 RepID=A0A1F5R4I1_9BACT|nr:MAG: pyridoxine 5'-phosphate synthase [Candidatus Edwardsbacteria bacterium RifOxyC12_full_54_24]OGF06764.1 MAG: pyridoxine 5'-phosphate synthase [Candidatus Edwardsbacteria bacterium RifOxyA12_full_54_48]OGF08831.1 MAG: pyridoxine 5'-phosphate synthase [Candidatus Edwardsbacteria bacterium GWF2_54_11]OGF10714.1 MAG: pyridoxine 5'-phosphate synthase [Candidatus Edwardsbacteria bacterium GWE2_54_12]OGJ18718.1 MAG: pyridoxine 5'-phosphate synthase [Candidatus Edwardsbacteria bacterium RifOxyB1
MERIRLGVNIDHVATLRQARRSLQPDPVWAAAVATLAGADGITVHLRSDRRHIQDRDVQLLRQTVNTHLNVELAADDEMVGMMVNIKPDAVCLVPENPDEITTEGGLDLQKAGDRVARAARQLKAAGVSVTCFIEPDDKQVKLARKLGADSIEINTNAFSQARGDRIQKETARVAQAAKLAQKLGLKVHAGHGLNYFNLLPVVGIPQITELNIGHAIIAQAVLVGLDRAVRDMKALLER